MSILARLYEVTPELLERVRHDHRESDRLLALRPPPKDSQPDVLAFLSGPRLLATADRLRPGQREAYLAHAAQMREGLENPQAVLAQVPGLVDTLDLAKTWHGLHYLLCGSATDSVGTLGQSVLGGTEFDEDRGYGPPRYLSPSQVSSIARALDAVSDADFRGRFDAAALEKADIYPNVWSEDDTALDWLVDGLRSLRVFYSLAAARGNAVVISLA